MNTDLYAVFDVVGASVSFTQNVVLETCFCQVPPCCGADCTAVVEFHMVVVDVIIVLLQWYLVFHC